MIKRLEAEGWLLSRVKGSHHQFKHPTKPGLVTVPHPKADIPKGTFHSIAKQAGWK
ncbi:type II toxin-antitoxin system HicA family toxin [Dyella nitratireducens]|uniref:type II toxin-antitoxin system HicA family toxin n=1 Tax=Dyella nitratireducens TaxID=1849580 RepID=UPI001E42E6DB|nr:type II toxin-antitoxin system HicA family toxin [Dyella nitratireducens]